MLKNIRISGILVTQGILYIVLLNFIPREDVGTVLIIYTVLFAGYVQLTFPYMFTRIQQHKLYKYLTQTSIDNIWLIVLAGIIFRCIALVSLPELSDDYFRFIWDGRLLANGINPFTKLPASYMESIGEAKQLGLTRELFESLNSPQYYTIYPPLNQYIFWLTAYISPNNIYHHVLGMKMILLLAEMGTLLLLPRLMASWNLPPSWSALYILNPLVIIELVGNLHFEALVIFFLLLSLFWLSKERWVLGALAMSLSIAGKLLPVIFLPIMIRRLGIIRTIAFSLIVIGINIILFIPLLDKQTILNMGDSIGLYFQSFEFNASIYYIVRWIGYQVRGYNVIQIVGKYLAITVFVGVWLITFFEKNPNWKNLPRTMVWVLTLYFAFASIVHPWYITTLLALSCLSQLRYAFIWSLMIMVSYVTYRNTDYEEILWLTALEYLIVFSMMAYEWVKLRNSRSFL